MKHKKLAIIVILILIAGGVFAAQKIVRHLEVQQAERLLDHPLPPASIPKIANDPYPNQMPLPEVNLPVPFTSQAPHADWSMPYQEACEEAALLMALRYVFGNPIIDPADADAALTDLLRTNEDILGYPHDQTAEQMVDLIHAIDPNVQVQLIQNPTVEDLTIELSRGNVIIVPASGRKLNNPFFRDPGPLYHMLVLRGYTEDGYFITNDPGTKRGEGYLYPFDRLMDAMGDWNDGDPGSGEKVVLLLKRIEGDQRQNVGMSGAGDLIGDSTEAKAKP